MASIFAHEGGYRSAHTFVHGMSVAVYVGAAIVAAGSLAAFLVKRGSVRRAEAIEQVPELEAAA